MDKIGHTGDIEDLKRTILKLQEENAMLERDNKCLELQNESFKADIRRRDVDNKNLQCRIGILKTEIAEMKANSKWHG